MKTATMTTSRSDNGFSCATAAAVAIVLRAVLLPSIGVDGRTRCRDGRPKQDAELLSWRNRDLDAVGERYNPTPIGLAIARDDHPGEFRSVGGRAAARNDYRKSQGRDCYLRLARLLEHSATEGEFGSGGLKGDAITERLGLADRLSNNRSVTSKSGASLGGTVATVISYSSVMQGTGVTGGHVQQASKG
jgi:hypothetical protein